MFILEITFVLFTLHLWTPWNMYRIRQHTLHDYLIVWVKIPCSLILSCNTPYFCDTLRDIKSFKTNLPVIFKSLISSNSNLFKDTENPFHFLMLSSSFSSSFNVGTLKILKVLRLMLWLCWNCYEWLLQFEPASFNILIHSPLGDNSPV